MIPQTHESSTFVRHVPCGACGSRDNNALYSDGHTHCFGCGAHTKAGDGTPTTSTRKPVPLDLILDGETRALHSRKITQETAEHFGYTIGDYKGKSVQIAPYYDATGQLVAQKIRTAGKDFKLLGSLDEALPFGATKFPKAGKKVVVTEGEIDAMSVSQVQGNKWPVVSIACGAGPQVKKYMAKHRDYFLGFDEVVLMFDNDEPGRAAAIAAAEVLGRKAKIAELPLKDPNELLKAGRSDDIVRALWNAKPYRPEGIVDMATLKDAAKEKPTFGLSYPWPSLTKLTYGIKLKKLIGWGAGVGSGKTDIFTQIIAHLVTEHHEKVAAFYLETPPAETAQRIAGKAAGKTFHVPDADWAEEDFDAAWDTLMRSGGVFLYDGFGNNEWEPIRDKIEYLHHAEGVRYFFLDHLTALAAWQDDERKALEKIMSEMGGLVQKLDITIFFVSHLATPEGKPHEEGGRVYAKHFKGSRAIIQWATDLFGVERDQQAEDEVERCTSLVRCLKSRTSGRGTGKTFQLRYNPDTGLLAETTSGESHGFTDETPEGTPSDF